MHGYYSGYKIQRGTENQASERQNEMHEFTYELLEDLELEPPTQVNCTSRWG